MISIIMPAYNVADYIAESIESVLAQTFTDFELIVINDGSTDNTVHIIDKYRQRDRRIKLLDGLNGGVSCARNKGLAVAAGEYISFLDADDLWQKNFLEKMYKKITAGSHDFVYCRYNLLMPDGAIKDSGQNKCPEGNITAFMEKSEIRLPMHICGVMLKHQLIGKSQMFVPERSLHEDIEFLDKLLLLNKAACLPEVLLIYRQRESSASHQQWNFVKAQQEIRVYIGLREFTSRNVPEMLDIMSKAADYKIYRFILGCVKRDCVSEALQMIKAYQPELRAFVLNGQKWNERLKCRLFLMENEKLLRLLR